MRKWAFALVVVASGCAAQLQETCVKEPPRVASRQAWVEPPACRNEPKPKVTVASPQLNPGFWP
jgi:hypothetical protein